MWSSATGLDASGDEYVLRVAVNEHAVDWPLDNVDQRASVQSYSVVRRAYSHYIDHCRPNQHCAAVSTTLQLSETLYQINLQRRTTVSRSRN